MRKKQSYGVFAAFICATSFILGLCLIFLIAPDFNQGAEARLRTLSQYSELMQLWYFLVYIVFGISLLVLSRSLLETKGREHTTLEQVTTLASYLWSCYIFASGFIAILSIEFLFTERYQFEAAVLDLWREIYAIQMGLGEGAEWVGAIWVVLINTCLLRAQRFTNAVVYFGYFIGVFGFATVIPSLTEIGALFGLLQIIWFIYAGILLLKEQGSRSKHSATF